MGWFSKKSDIPNGEQYVKLHNEGIAAFHAGNLQQAIDLLYQAFNAIDCTPTNKSAEGWLFIGLAEMQLHDRDQNPQRLNSAEGALLGARALDHNNLFIIYNLGTCYNKQKRLNEAEQCFLEHIRLQPSANALIELGIICHKTSRKQEAVSYWEQALKLDPGCVAAKQNLENARKFY